MRVVYMGTPDFAVLPLKHLINNHFQVVAIYTQPDKPSGRGQLVKMPPLKIVARDLSIPVNQPDDFKEQIVLNQLSQFNPDVIVVAAYGKLLPKTVINLPRYGCINIHPSLLPKYRGSSPVQEAILSGDEYTGISVMLIDKGLDTGPILTKAQIPITSSDNSSSLMTKLSVVAAFSLQDVLIHWVRGEIVPKLQNEALASYSPSISREFGRIDWNLSAEDIWRQVRAYYSWPGSYTSWQGKQLKILEALPLPGGAGYQIGQTIIVPRDNDAGFGVVTGSGVLGVIKVQLEGKKALLAGDFLRGQHHFLGSILS
jgi:methionyl-tRNA formyltransferase